MLDRLLGARYSVPATLRSDPVEVRRLGVLPSGDSKTKYLSLGVEKRFDSLLS